MSEKKWTPEQEAAIGERGEILVAAAAGSGKTAVLVERLLRRILDRAEAVDVDRFLVVTFTKAAAQEMRARIRLTLEDRLFAESSPEDSQRLQRQLNLLPRADITNLHAFCLDLIRRYFYCLELDPDVRVAGEEEIGILKQDVLAAVFEAGYEAEDPVFLELVEGFGSDRGDEPLMAEVLRLYEFARSQPEPEGWLGGLRRAYSWADEFALLESPWGQSVKEGIRDKLAEIVSLLSQAENLALSPDGPSNYRETLAEDLEQMRELTRIVAEERWGSLAQAIEGVRFGRLPGRRGNKNAGLTEEVKHWRDAAKKSFEAWKKGRVWELSSQVRGLNEMARPAEGLVRLTGSFAAAFAQAKRQRNILDFNDLEHFALRLLTDRNGVAETLRKQYAEILVDEYQDINAVQERIIRCIAGTGKDLFLVGDVKQSIYRFRMADPGLFLAKYRTFPHWRGPGLPRESQSLVVDLAKNFRSRREILAGVNFVFRQIMTEEAGEIAYDERAALRYGAAYAGSAPGLTTAEGPIEVHLLSPVQQVQQESGGGTDEAGTAENGTQDKTGAVGTCAADKTGAAETLAGGDGEPPEEEERDANRQEAFLVARRIRAMVEQGGEFQVYDAELKSYRGVRYSDIVVLQRSQASVGPLYVEEFNRAGVPVFAETGSGYFAAGEVETVVSLLRVIDNPRQDIPLAAVLRSAFAGFNGSDLGKLRALLPEGDFYEPLTLAAWAGEPEEITGPGNPEPGQSRAQVDPDSGSGRERSPGMGNYAGYSGEIEDILQAHQSTWPVLLERSHRLPREVKEKAVKFWRRLQSWRDYSVHNSLADLISLIYRETGYPAYCGTLPGGAQRLANLEALYDRACQFEQTHYRGLFRFLRFLERFREEGQDMGQARNLGEKENVVRLMTIHASKGLEFPVVFVVGLGRAFNTANLAGTVLIHPDLGLGLPILDFERRVRYPSFIQQAIRQRLSRDFLAEELRLLYVALTRAKEKLLLYGSIANPDRTLAQWCSEAGDGEGPLPAGRLRGARRFLDWIGPALARHPQQPFGSAPAESAEGALTEEDSLWQVFIHRGCEEEQRALSEVTAKANVLSEGVNAAAPDAQAGKTVAAGEREGSEALDGVICGSEKRANEGTAGDEPEEEYAQQTGEEDAEKASEEDAEEADEEYAETVDEEYAETVDEECAEKVVKDYEAEIARRLAWVYPWQEEAAGPAKTSVSELKRRQFEESADAVESSPHQRAAQPALRPKFLQGEKEPTAAERGITLHSAMQHIPLALWAERLVDRRAEERTSVLAQLVADYGRFLAEEEILHPQQVVSLPWGSIVRFFCGPLGERMLTAAEVRREVPFTLALPAAEGCLPQLVQGVMDALLFPANPEPGSGRRKVELVDYKTDHLPAAGQSKTDAKDSGDLSSAPEANDETNDEVRKILTKRYSLQMAYYLAAAEKLLRVEVNRVTLYAFGPEREVVLPAAPLRAMLRKEKRERG
ncbi:ATP-dependent helicase/nuclease subunit A [Peptococcaceae bacterium CEB3]|nr:ATP-dependent helicase/nuclease subunit A [Peptococcaceae bacterium CEB3]